MWSIKQINLIKKMLVEDNEYIIFIEVVFKDEIKGKILSKTQRETRFCKAKKNGDIVINYNGEKINTNINQIP